MSEHSGRPSRTARWLLRLASSQHASEAAVGDLLEELNERTEMGKAPRWPGLWLECRILQSAVSLAWMAALRLRRVSRQMVRDAARGLRRAPAPSLFTLAILSVGIAAGTVTFSVVDAVVLRPLPFDQGEALVMVSGRNLLDRATPLAPEEFWAIHDRVTGLEAFAPARHFETAVDFGTGTEQLPVMYSTAELFRVLRLGPLLGQLWTAEDERRGDLDVAVISHGLWQRRFGQDPLVLGRGLRIGNVAYRVAAVLEPAAERQRAIGWTHEVWIPRVPEMVGTSNGVSRSIFAIGRMRDGVSLEQLTAEVRSAIAPLAQAQPYAYTDWRPEVMRWQHALIGDVRGWMLLVLGAVGLVVLITCVNAANLMLTRSFERARELAVRASLGASRRQLALTVLVESLMLSTASALCALVFSTWGIDAARAALPRGIWRAETIALDGRVLAASLTAALLTGMLSGLVPAWQASRVSVVMLLKDAGPTLTAGRRRWRSVLLIIEVACVAALMVVSTLFIGSFVHATTLDLGFERSNRIAVKTLTNYEGTVEDVKTRLAQIPGVVGVTAVTYSSPLLVGSAFGGAWSESVLKSPGEDADVSTEVEMYSVTSDYFEVAGIPFRHGSTWPSSSAAATNPSRPIVVDEPTARQLFGDVDAVGRQVKVLRLNGNFTIVGVVPYVFARGPERSSRPSAYHALNPATRPKWVSFLVRTSESPAPLVSTVAGALKPLLPPGTVPEVHVLDDAFRQLTATRRFVAWLMSGFALVAILIGAAGIYAVMASTVVQRTREIGVRVALGATAGDIRQSVLTQAARHLLVGLAAGLPAAWWMSRGFGAVFFHVTPGDPSIYLMVTVTLTIVGLVAAVIPARRAVRVDPVVSLRAN
jgi:predicted permease